MDANPPTTADYARAQAEDNRDELKLLKEKLAALEARVKELETKRETIQDAFLAEVELIRKSREA